MFVLSPKTLSYVCLTNKSWVKTLTDQYIGLHLISPTHEGEIERTL